MVDAGCGSGVLSVLAARAGATSVLAVEAHASLCCVARAHMAVREGVWAASVTPISYCSWCAPTHAPHAVLAVCPIVHSCSAGFVPPHTLVHEVLCLLTHPSHQPGAQLMTTGAADS